MPDLKANWSRHPAHQVNSPSADGSLARAESEMEQQRSWHRPVRRPTRHRSTPASVENVVALPIDKIRREIVQDPDGGRMGFAASPNYSARNRETTMFTDTEIGMTLAHDREMAGVVGEANDIIAGKNVTIARLQIALAESHRQLARERAKRMAVELRLEKVLNMPI